MKRKRPKRLTTFVVVAIGAVMVCAASEIAASKMPTLSVTYELLPYQDFDEKIIDSISGADTTYFEHPQAQLRKLRGNLTYPIVFAQGKTVLVNDISYQLIEFRYHQLEFPLERLQSASYTLMLQQQLSPKWSFWGLASDLRSEISEKDFNFQAAGIFIRHFSERLAVGLGAAYTTQFGSGAVVPILALDWNNGKNLMAKAIVPANFEFWYRPNARFDLGLVASGDGNDFRGDPDLYNVANPQLRYTMLTVGPAARIRVVPYVRLNLEAGLIGLHRFEFFDDDTKVVSHDLKPKQYARVGLTFGE